MFHVHVLRTCLGAGDWKCLKFAPHLTSDQIHHHQAQVSLIQLKLVQD